MRIILLGSPGSGKGTQAQFISKKYQIPQISTGDMLREAIADGSQLGKEAQAVMAAGQLVSDHIILKLVAQRITKDDCAGGFLFDGFPRTVAQAEGLAKMQITLDAVLEIAVADNDIVKRMAGRRVHLPSGRVYHLQFNKPKRYGVDDISGEPLSQREDDNPDTVKKRLQVYHQQTQPLVAHYQQQKGVAFASIDGVGEVDEIANNIRQTLATITEGQ